MKLSSLPRWLTRLLRLLAALVLLSIFFLAGWWLSGSADGSTGPSTEMAETEEIWTCSMHPQIRQPEPGLCPICSMDLIPLDQSEGGGLRELSISEEAAALLDVRVAPVIRAPAAAEVHMFGRIAYNERLITTITARVAGRLDRLFVDFTGITVRKNDKLGEIYSPDLLVAQRELIEARRGLAAVGGSDAARGTRLRLLESAREKLRLLDFSEDQIAAIEASDNPEDHLTLTAPQAGIVTAKLVNEGQYVDTGQALFELADLSSVWLRLEAYESDLQWLRYAQRVEFTVEALPGRTFVGRIAFIDPDIDPMRRVTSVRVNVENPGQLLKPGMFAQGTVISPSAADGRVLDPSLAGKWVSPMHPEIIEDGPGQCSICGMDLVPAEELGFIPNPEAALEPLQVPASAILRTGRRAVVYVRIDEEEGPIFEGRQIVLGPRVGNRYLVETGLEEGELVVTRGAFMLDSELQIRAKPSMMNPDAGLKERPAFSAPASLAGQWSPMPRLLHQLLAFPGEDKLEPMRQLIVAIDVSELDSQERARWDELSRRLLNELQLAMRQIDDQPATAATAVARAVEEAGRYLGLPFEPEAPPLVDEVLAGHLRTVLDAYLPLAAALAADEDQQSAKAARSLVDALESSPIPRAKELTELASVLAATEDIESRRTAFKPLSETLIKVIEEHGVDAVGNAYVVHCPMAAGGAGADWLSARPEVVNPYFGEAMLNCGALTATLSTDSER